MEIGLEGVDYLAMSNWGFRIFNQEVGPIHQKRQELWAQEIKLENSLLLTSAKL